MQVCRDTEEGLSDGLKEHRRGISRRSGQEGFQMTDKANCCTFIECSSPACRDIHISIELNEGTWMCREVIKEAVNNPENEFKIKELLD